MEVKLLEIVADDGKTYTAVGFRDDGAVDGDAQAQIDAALAAQKAAEEARDNALNALNEAEETAKENGLAQGRAECAAKHFYATFTGDGTMHVTFEVDFDPDFYVIWTSCAFPVDEAYEGKLVAQIIDMKAEGAACGISTTTKLNSKKTDMIVSMGMKPTMYSVNGEDWQRAYVRDGGSIIFSSVNPTLEEEQIDMSNKFESGVLYHIFALKLPEDEV